MDISSPVVNSVAPDSTIIRAPSQEISKMQV